MEQRRTQRVKRMPPSRQAPLPEVEERASVDDEEDVWPATRLPSSARRYQGLADVRTEAGRVQADVLSPSSARRGSRALHTERQPAIPARRSATTQTQVALPNIKHRRVTQDEDEEDAIPARPVWRGLQGRRPHWLFWAGLALFVMVVGWIALSAVANWWQITLDDWRYGRPRTYQVDALVGHNDSPTNMSHFIAINLNRRVEIIEFPGGDPSKAKIYLGPVLIGPDEDLAPVTLEFRDVNGDGRPDMIVDVQGSHFVFINENGGFRPLRPGENVRL